jgi:hypothetical protein
VGSRSAPGPEGAVFRSRASTAAVSPFFFTAGSAKSCGKHAQKSMKNCARKTCAKDVEKRWRNCGWTPVFLCKTLRISCRKPADKWWKSGLPIELCEVR